MILLFISLLLAILFVITPRIVEGAVPYTVADKDSYIENAKTARNWGNDNVLKTGYGPPLYETYIHFNLTNKPSNFIKAELTLKIWSVDTTANFTLSITDGNWDEMSICWNNKPAHVQTLGEITVSANDTYKIDLTPLIIASTTISFCISKSVGHLFEDMICIASKDRASDKPRIVWTYEETVTDEIPGYNVFIMIGIIAVVVRIFFARKRSPKM